MATKGCCRRGLAAWMAFATTSLPVPVSPRTRTALSTGATMLISSSKARNLGLEPIKSDIAIVPLLAEQFRNPGQSSGGVIQGELDCAQQIRGVERLVQESGGALTEGSLSNLIVIVGGNQRSRVTRGYWSLTRRCNSSPSIPGILTSVIRQTADSGAPDCRNSSAEAKTKGVCPAEATRLSIDSRTLKSSSTAATMCLAEPAFKLESQPRFDHNRRAGRAPLYVYLGVSCSARKREFVGHADQFGERSRTHFAHDLAAMNADGDLAGAQFRGGLLIRQSRHHEGQHFPLARGEQRVVLLQLRQFRSAPAALFDRAQGPRRSRAAVPDRRKASEETQSPPLSWRVPKMEYLRDP